MTATVALSATLLSDHGEGATKAAEWHTNLLKDPMSSPLSTCSTSLPFSPGGFSEAPFWPMTPASCAAFSSMGDKIATETTDPTASVRFFDDDDEDEYILAGKPLWTTDSWQLGPIGKAPSERAETDLAMSFELQKHDSLQTQEEEEKEAEPDFAGYVTDDDY